MADHDKVPETDDSVSTAQSVALVIPGRNCAATIGPCLAAAVAVRDREPLTLVEIIFVDDASTDDSRRVASAYPVTCLSGQGRGPAAARNVGWRASTAPLVWFVDSDCIAEPDALERLLPHLRDAAVGAVGGSLGIANPQHLLARLVHEEIMVRHDAMGSRVDFLAAANVVYRRSVLERCDGFDERYVKAQDADLAMRARDAGFELAFERGSRVKHTYIVRLRKYLYTQLQQGYWRVRLHLTHRGRARGDSYSNLLDHVQPPLGVIALTAVPVGVVARQHWLFLLPTVLLAVMQLPMTIRLVKRSRDTRYATFVGLGFLRAIWRGVGMTLGVLSLLRWR